MVCDEPIKSLENLLSELEHKVLAPDYRAVSVAFDALKNPSKFNCGTEFAYKLVRNQSRYLKGILHTNQFYQENLSAKALLERAIGFLDSVC